MFRCKDEESLAWRMKGAREAVLRKGKRGTAVERRARGSTLAGFVLRSVSDVLLLATDKSRDTSRRKWFCGWDRVGQTCTCNKGRGRGMIRVAGIKSGQREIMSSRFGMNSFSLATNPVEGALLPRKHHVRFSSNILCFLLGILLLITLLITLFMPN
ncbi:hypothetical protein Pcinc_043671 [Petrolisthes cinctipes]|uniref:Uncharacterized protein n=1 Tax=Petrolisthes cinctipes TaxID=88211 RepID=A0AAE1BG76_PETCI|nr:hypothetical protein Pcinc_043671 [Petrolisthes cinctipes]